MRLSLIETGVLEISDIPSETPFHRHSDHQEGHWHLHFVHIKDMFSCCGFGRRRKQGGSGQVGIKGNPTSHALLIMSNLIQQINDERTPLLDPSSVIPLYAWLLSALTVMNPVTKGCLVHATASPHHSQGSSTMRHCSSTRGG